MEKRGVVEVGRTRDIHDESEKQAAAMSERQKVESLDDDFTKKAADAATAKLNRSGS